MSVRSHVLLLLLLAATVTAIFAQSAIAAKSVSQWGITWTWTQDLPVGQFANGEYYVVAPSGLTLTGPVSTGGRNGSMINTTQAADWPSQGFDDRVDLTYNDTLNIGTQMPYAVPAGSTIVSCISRTDVTDSRNQLRILALLTVLPSAPPAGSFRPTYFGTDKTIKWNKSDIIYDRLKDLPPLAGAPSPSGLATAFAHTMFQLGRTYKSNYVLGYENTPNQGANYGREISAASAKAALALNCDYTDAQKEQLAINYIQWGLDCYEGIVRGQHFDAAGGHMNGHKLATLMAGWLLDDSEILAVVTASGGHAGGGYPNNASFSEDQAHFYVTQNDIDLPRYVSTSQPAEPYTSEHLGMPEWGPSGGYPENSAGSQWGRAYRDVTGPGLVGCALAVKIMGQESVWNHQSFLDYFALRFVPTEHAGELIDPWVKAMWDAYSGTTTPSPTPKQGTGGTPAQPKGRAPAQIKGLKVRG